MIDIPGTKNEATRPILLIPPIMTIPTKALMIIPIIQRQVPIISGATSKTSTRE